MTANAPMSAPISADMTEPEIRAKSLVSRLVRAALLWAVPLLLITAFALSWFYRNSTYRILDDPLVGTVQALITTSETIVQDDGNVVVTINREPLDPRYQSALSGLYWEVQFPGKPESNIWSRSLYGGTMDLPPTGLKKLAENPGEELRTFSEGPDGEPLRVVARSIILPNLERPIIMVAGVDQRPALRAIQQFALMAILLVAALTLGLIGAVLVQVRTGLRPLFDLSERVADVREGRADQVEGDYPREIAPVARELNSLILHNRGIVERARTHVGNLAHALKTPLAVLRNEARTNDTPLAEVVRRQTETMNSQVDHHLSRARAAARAQVTAARADITQAVQDLTRTLSRIYRSRDIGVTEALQAGILFRGERRDLDDMIGNLLDNAHKWAKGRVSVTSAIDKELSDFVRITVEDDGPGIEDDKTDQALKRGVRLDETTPGTGFGLAIVDDLAQAYGGSLTLSRSPMGGLKGELRLPRALNRTRND